MYFQLHEMPVEIKKKINVKIVEEIEEQKTNFEIVEDKPKVSIKFNDKIVNEKEEIKKTLNKKSSSKTSEFLSFNEWSKKK